jgi:hypothetical protein
MEVLEVEVQDVHHQQEELQHKHLIQVDLLQFMEIQVEVEIIQNILEVAEVLVVQENKEIHQDRQEEMEMVEVVKV